MKLLAWAIKHGSHGLYFDNLLWLPEGEKPETGHDFVRMPKFDTVIEDCKEVIFIPHGTKKVSFNFIGSKLLLKRANGLSPKAVGIGEEVFECNSNGMNTLEFEIDESNSLTSDKGEVENSKQDKVKGITINQLIGKLKELPSSFREKELLYVDFANVKSVDGLAIHVDPKRGVYITEG